MMVASCVSAWMLDAPGACVWALALNAIASASAAAAAAIANFPRRALLFRFGEG